MKYPLCVAVLLYLAPSTLPAGEELVKFVPEQTELRLINDRWFLCCGRTGIKDLGPDERTAREALNLVRDLRLTQRGSIGQPLPVIEYWLADSKAPQALTRNLTLQAFNPDRLHVEQLQGQWCVLDGPQVMFGFGPHAEDARRAMAVLKQYGFNRVGFVGRPTPVMMYFLATDEAMPQAAPASPSKTAAQVPLAVTLPNYQMNVPSQSPEELEQASDHVYFDWFRTEVDCIDGHWKLLAGERCLADFGIPESDARAALDVVRFYHFTEQCRTGSSPSACTYYLVNGAPPRGLMLDLNCVEIDAEALALRQDGDVWKLCEHSRSLLVAGASFEEANATLQTVQRLQITHICHLGNPERPALTVLVRDR
jgi:hypothetical protein